MDTFVVLTSDDKWGTLSPDVIGPFDDEDAAIRFVTRLPDRTSGPGGYASDILVNARTATSPKEWQQARDEQDEGI